MTAPVPPPNEVAFEKWVTQQVAGPLRAAVGRAIQRIVGLYIALAGGLGNPLPQTSQQIFADEVKRILQEQLSFQGQAVLKTSVDAAVAIGVARATSGGVTQPAPGTPSALNLPDWVDTLVGTMNDRILTALTRAIAAWNTGAPPKDFKDVMGRVALANQAVTMAERDAGWAVNAAINAGARDVMDLAGVPRVWVGEDDACLHCLAYIGQVALPGQPFPGGLTYYVNPAGAFKPLGYAPVWDPPLHPHCRCRPEPYFGMEADYPVMPWESGVTSFPEALRREARRKVLRGQSGSDSLPARLRAADGLLAVGAGLPKSVEARSRAAVRAGHF